MSIDIYAIGGAVLAVILGLAGLISRTRKNTTNEGKADAFDRVQKGNDRVADGRDKPADQRLRDNDSQW